VIDADGLRALEEKYRELIALRRDASRDDARLRTLASRFPGALRELDTRTMESLEERVVEIEAALRGGPAPPWADAQLRFHGWVRVALRLRADGVRDLESARAWLATYAPREPGDPRRDEIDEAHLAALVHPPRGRVSLAAKALLAAGDVDLDELLFARRR
jgi:hypothetical protein